MPLQFVAFHFTITAALFSILAASEVLFIFLLVDFICYTTLVISGKLRRCCSTVKYIHILTKQKQPTNQNGILQWWAKRHSVHKQQTLYLPLFSIFITLRIKIDWPKVLHLNPTGNSEKVYMKDS